MDARKKSKMMVTFNLVMTGVWGLLFIPTVIWWKESILWVAFMSLYANVVGHWSAYQAARAEVTAQDNNSESDSSEPTSAKIPQQRTKS